MENLLLLPNVSVCTVVCKELENRISQEMRNYGSKKLLASFLNSIEITMHPFLQDPAEFSFAFLFRKLHNPIKTKHMNYVISITLWYYVATRKHCRVPHTTSSVGAKNLKND